MRRIINISLPSPRIHGDEKNLFCALVDEQETVISIHPMEAQNSTLGESWDGDWLSPMGVDLQINGGLGVSFSQLKFEELPKLLKLLDHLWIDGVEAICPTIVSCDVSSLREALEVIHVARKKHSENRCVLLGSHLEGPFIAKSRCGAHSSEFICNPNLLELEERIQGFENEIAVVTLAPELPGCVDLINRLEQLGIVISLGHSEADADIALAAFDQGVRMLTHVFNAMPGLHHRDPGPIGEALTNGNIFMSLIVDGQHVTPSMANLLNKLAPEQLVLISDALSMYGLHEDEFLWDGKKVLVDKGTCRLEDGTLAGVSLPLLEGCIRFASWTGNPANAIWAATFAPRRVLNDDLKLLESLVGQPLQNLLRWKTNSVNKKLVWHRAA